jgi:hypothetical protein
MFARFPLSSSEQRHNIRASLLEFLLITAQLVSCSEQATIDESSIGLATIVAFISYYLLEAVFDP